MTKEFEEKYRRAAEKIFDSIDRDPKRIDEIKPKYFRLVDLAITKMIYDEHHDKVNEFEVTDDDDVYDIVRKCQQRIMVEKYLEDYEKYKDEIDEVFGDG